MRRCAGPDLSWRLAWRLAARRCGARRRRARDCGQRRARADVPGAASGDRCARRPPAGRGAATGPAGEAPHDAPRGCDGSDGRHPDRLRRRRGRAPAAPGAGPDARAGECAALADTIALIIERYWREVGYDAPPLAPPNPPPPPQPPPAPPPPAPPPAVAVEARRAASPSRAAAAPSPPWRWSAAAAVAGRAGDAGARDASALIAVGVEGRIGLRLSAASPAGRRPRWPPGRRIFDGFPLRLGGYLPIHVGVGQLEPGLGVDLDLISFGSAAMGASRTSGRRPPAPRVFAGPPAPIWRSGWSYASAITSSCAPWGAWGWRLRTTSSRKPTTQRHPVTRIGVRQAPTWRLG